MSARPLRIIYWTATLAFGVPQTWSALQYLLGMPAMVQSIAALGYPMYFMKLLAMAKLAGMAAILSGRFSMLKEWAYAGFTFEVTAAILSCWSVGGALSIPALPVALLVVQLVSYWSWRLESTRWQGASSLHRA